MEIVLIQGFFLSQWSTGDRYESKKALNAKSGASYLKMGKYYRKKDANTESTYMEEV